MNMNIMKALIPSTILTLIVSAVVGFSGTTGGFMNLQHADIGGYAIYWSWTLFFTAMALNGCILLQIAKQETAAAPTESQKHDQEAQLADKEPRIAG